MVREVNGINQVETFSYENWVLLTQENSYFRNFGCGVQKHFQMVLFSYYLKYLALKACQFITIVALVFVIISIQTHYLWICRTGLFKMFVG